MDTAVCCLPGREQAAKRNLQTKNAYRLTFLPETELYFAPSSRPP